MGGSEGVVITAVHENSGATRCAAGTWDSLFEALTDPLILLGEGGDRGTFSIANVNRAACEVLGYSRKALSGLCGAVLIESEPPGQWADELAQAQGGALFEAFLLTKGGQRIPVEIKASVADLGGQRVWALLCRDVTLRRLVMETLDSAQKNYRKIFEMAVNGVFQSTLEGRFLKGNPAMAEMLGFDSPGQMLVEIMNLGRQVYADPDDRREFCALLKDKGEVRRFETRFLRRNGTVLWVSLTARLVRGESELDSYIEGFCEDVTDYKLAERALRDSEELHRETLNRLGDTVFITRDDGSFTYISPNTDAMFGLGPSDVMFLGTIEALLGDGLFDSSALDETGELTNLDAAIETSGGVPRSLLVSVKKVDIRGGTRLFVCRDVTERRLLRAEAVRAAHLASLGEMAAGVAHEINNPINGIMLYAELLKEGAAALGDNADVPDCIIRQGERVAAIVRNLLAFSRKPEAGAGPVNAREILDDSLALMRMRLVRDNVVLDLDVPLRLPSVLGRDQEIQQVFLNLLSNAHDALNSRYPGRDPNKRLRIVFGVVEEGQDTYLRAEFLDQGAGIPREIMDRIFDPFFSTKPKNYGTGLGLSTTHKIVTDMGGRIRFESEVGQYTSAVIDFPACLES